MRFSNKIPKYSHVSVLSLAGQKSPAEQWFVGGVFALSACYVGKAADLLHCLRVSALFVLWFFRLRTWPPTLSPTWSRSWSPTFTSTWHWLAGLIRIFRCKPALLHTSIRSAHTFGPRLSLPVIHAPALGSDISALEASAASALHCCASALKASSASTLHCGASALEDSAAFTLHCWTSALETSSASTLHCGASTASAGHRSTLHHHVPASKSLAAWAHASALEALTESAQTSTLPAPDVLIRTLAERAIWARYPGIVRLCRLEVCTHSWYAGHSASPSWTAAATPAASARTGKRLAGQNRKCQCNNDRCFDSCLFHFQFLSLMFRFAAFLSPLLGSFYRDSGAGGKKVTPGVNFSGKIFVLSIENGRLRKYQPVSAAIYFTSMFRLSCKSGIKTKKNLQTG